MILHMKKIYEHNDKALKSFIIGDHQIDLLESSKKGLLLSITDNNNNDTSSLFVPNKVFHLLFKLVYENLMLINSGIKSKTIRHIRITHTMDKGNVTFFSKFGDGSIKIITNTMPEYPHKVIIDICIADALCHRITIKSINDILVVENI